MENIGGRYILVPTHGFPFCRTGINEDSVKEVNIGIIGAGFMGAAHSTAFSNVPFVYGGAIRPVLKTVVDLDKSKAKGAAEQFGFEKYSTDWREVVNDPDIELVDITTPNSSHAEIAITAAGNGKHIYCEKPLAMNTRQAKDVVAAVSDAGVVSMVGFNYLKNPAQVFAQDLVLRGELGSITSFRGSFDQDYEASPESPFSWRYSKSVSATGALGDLASHVFSIARFLVGDVEKIMSLSNIVYPFRKDPESERMRPVENDDLIHILCQFENGALGSICSSRIASGRKIGLTYEIQGTRGSLYFNQERMNELKLYRHTDPAEEQGFKTILIGPEHSDYRYFYGGAGIALGYGDQKTIEAHAILKAVSDNRPVQPDFVFGLKINQAIDAALLSSLTGEWIKVSEVQG